MSDEMLDLLCMRRLDGRNALAAESKDASMWLATVAKRIEDLRIANGIRAYKAVTLASECQRLRTACDDLRAENARLKSQ